MYNPTQICIKMDNIYVSFSIYYLYEATHTIKNGAIINIQDSVTTKFLYCQIIVMQ